MRVIAAIFANAVALLATTVVPGISFDGSVWTLLLAGALFGLFNLVVRPIALLLSLPFLILSLGLFYFVLNGLLLWGVSGLLPRYTVSGPLAGILGGLVIGVVNWALGTVASGSASPKARRNGS